MHHINKLHQLRENKMTTILQILSEVLPVDDQYVPSHELVKADSVRTVCTLPDDNCIITVYENDDTSVKGFEELVKAIIKDTSESHATEEGDAPKYVIQADDKPVKSAKSIAKRLHTEFHEKLKAFTAIPEGVDAQEYCDQLSGVFATRETLCQNPLVERVELVNQKEEASPRYCVQFKVADEIACKSDYYFTHEEALREASAEFEAMLDYLKAQL